MTMTILLIMNRPLGLTFSWESTDYEPVYHDGKQQNGLDYCELSDRQGDLKRTGYQSLLGTTKPSF